MRHRTKLLYRILSMSLAALMVFTSAPMPAFAEEAGIENEMTGGEIPEGENEDVSEDVPDGASDTQNDDNEGTSEVDGENQDDSEKNDDEEILADDEDTDDADNTASEEIIDEELAEEDAIEVIPAEEPIEEEEVQEELTDEELAEFKEEVANGDIDVMQMLADGLTDKQIDELVELGVDPGVQAGVSNVTLDYNGRITWKAPVNGKPGYDNEDCVLRYVVSVYGYDSSHSLIDTGADKEGCLETIKVIATAKLEKEGVVKEYDYAIRNYTEHLTAQEILFWQTRFSDLKYIKVSVVAQSIKGNSTETFSAESDEIGTQVANWPETPVWSGQSVAKIDYKYSENMIASRSEILLTLYKKSVAPANKVTYASYYYDNNTTTSSIFTESIFCNYIKTKNTNYYVVAETRPCDYRYRNDIATTDALYYHSSNIMLSNVKYDAKTDYLTFKIVNPSYGSKKAGVAINISSPQMSVNQKTFVSDEGYLYGDGGHSYYLPSVRLNLYELWNDNWREGTGNTAKFTIKVAVVEDATTYSDDTDYFQTDKMVTKTVTLKMPARLKISGLGDIPTQTAGAGTAETSDDKFSVKVHWNTSNIGLTKYGAGETAVKIYTGDEIKSDDSNLVSSPSITTSGESFTVNNLSPGIYTAKITTKSNNPLKLFNSAPTKYTFAVNYDYVKALEIKNQEYIGDPSKENSSKNCEISVSAVDSPTNTIAFDVFPVWRADHPEWGDPSDVEFTNSNEAAFKIKSKAWVEASGSEETYVGGHFHVVLEQQNIDASIDGRSVITVSDKQKHAKSVKFTARTLGSVHGGLTVSIGAGEEQYYTGGNRNPVVTVCDGDAVLQKNKDYTVTYKNNKNIYTVRQGEAGFNAKKAPQIILKGKGAYSSKTITLYYVINPVTFRFGGMGKTESELYADLKPFAGGSGIINVSSNSKAQTISVPVIVTDGVNTYGTLKQGTDYIVQYTNDDGLTWLNTIPAKATGEFKYRIVAKNRNIITESAPTYIPGYSINVVSPNNNINKAAVSAITKSYSYDEVEAGKTNMTIDGAEMTVFPIEASSIKVSCNKKTVPATGYEAYLIVGAGNDATVMAGKASVYVSAIGSEGYVGAYTAKSLVTISSGKSLAAKSVKAVQNAAYTWQGKNLTADDIKTYITVTDADVLLTYDVDYKITSIKKGNAPGKATVTLTGLEKYAGTKKTLNFVIGKNAASDAADAMAINKLTIYEPGGSVLISPDMDGVYTGQDMIYKKAGVKPAYVVKVGDTQLKANKDYTITYSGNAKAGNAKATIKLKGNYSSAKSYVVNFLINKYDASNLSVSVSDVAYKNKKPNYAAAVKVSDGTKALKAGTDYTVSYSVIDLDTLDESGKPVKRTLGKEVVYPGTRIYVTVTGKGNYEGTNTSYIYMKPALLSSAKLTSKKVYLEQKGVAVDYTASIPQTIKIGKLVLQKDIDFTVEPMYATDTAKYNSYYGSIGKKSIIIKARPNSVNCGGTKTVTFTVLPKIFAIFN